MSSLFYITIVLYIQYIICVSADTECYPTCSTYTTPITTTSTSLTTPTTNTITINKFNHPDKTLTKITILTKLKFDSTTYATCNNPGTCDNGYTSSIVSGVAFSMDLASPNNNILPRYWGRWGDYPSTTELAIECIGGTCGTNNLFRDYTYPLFDIDGYTPIAPYRWGYYEPNGDKQAQFFFGTISSGKVVSLGDADNNYYDDSFMTEDTLGPKSSRTITPYTLSDTSKHTLNIDTYDHTSIPFSKIIDLLNDDNGGVDNSITRDAAAAPFIGAGTVDWVLSMTGLVQDADEDSVVLLEQLASSLVSMQIRYDYIDAAFSGDPQFNGFQGQSFQVHGYPGTYFHLLSAPSFQMNGRFAYLASGHCGYNHTICWTHPGTYIDDLTFIINELLVRITAGSVNQGYTVRINDVPYELYRQNKTTNNNKNNNNDENSDNNEDEFIPIKFYDATSQLTIHLKSKLEVIVKTELVSFTIVNADMFFNMQSNLLLRPLLTIGRHPSTKYPHPHTKKPWFPSYPIHGFIGQTWCNARYIHNHQYDGDVDDYVETHAYGTESMYSQYQKEYPKEMPW